MKIPLVGAELFHADRRSYMAKPIAAFHKSANALKNSSLIKAILGIH